MSEEAPPQGPLGRVAGWAAFIVLMLLAAASRPLLLLVPPPARQPQSFAGDLCVEWLVMLSDLYAAWLVHLRCGERALGAVRCPACGRPVDVRFTPCGRGLLVQCPTGIGWHSGADMPMLWRPPAWWRSRVERPWWESSRPNQPLQQTPPPDAFS